MTQRWKITLEYDGAPFSGWQKQDDAVSVQETIENAIFAFTTEHVSTHVAGRTDAGVHALGQVAHFDLERSYDPEKIRDAINALVRPHPVAVIAAEPVDENFHARFKARKRVYCYRLTTGRRTPLILDFGRAWHVQAGLDIKAMNEAAQHLVGNHDFSSFRAAECQAESPVRTLDKLEVSEVTHPTHGTHVEIWAEARSFLHHQIRNITGTLKLVGAGKLMPHDVKTILDARDRTKAGPKAPAEGLYFMRVDY